VSLTPRAMLGNQGPSAAGPHGALSCSTESPGWSRASLGSAPTGDRMSACSSQAAGDGNRFPEIAPAQSFRGLQALNEPGRPDLPSRTAANGTAGRVSIPVLNVHEDPGSTTRICGSLAPTTSQATTAARMRRVPRSLRERSRSPAFVAVCLGGNTGQSRSVDRSSQTRVGTSARSSLTRSIPTSQCMTCHMHQPNVFMNTLWVTQCGTTRRTRSAMWPREAEVPDT